MNAKYDSGSTEMEQWLRLIKIIQHLVRRDALTIKDLYRILGGRVSVRTLQRDMEKLLAEPEIPVAELPLKGREKKYHIETWFKDKFSRSALDLNEAIAGKLIIQSMGIFRGTPLEESIRNFEEKFSRLIPNDIFQTADRKMEGLTAGFSTFVPGMYDYSQQGELIIRLINAVIERRVCRFTYRKPRAEEVQEYAVLPLKILQYQGCLYFYARKYENNAIRLFVIHRIDSLTVTEETFTMTDELRRDLRQRERRAIGVYEENTLKAQQVVLVFNAAVAHRIKDRMWHASQVCTVRDDGSVELALTVPLTEELISWILHWQAFVRVEKPARLRKDILDRARAVARLYTDTKQGEES